MSNPVRLVVYHADEDDPKKCTARKLQRFGYAVLDRTVRRLPSSAVLLDPFAEKSISREDQPIVLQHGLVTLDCSWKTA